MKAAEFKNFGAGVPARLPELRIGQFLSTVQGFMRLPRAVLPDLFLGSTGLLQIQLNRRSGASNPKRVYRLLREDNLLCIRKRKFVVTTDSNHNRRVYPNLTEQMTLSGINQLWVADIRCIRLEAGEV